MQSYNPYSGKPITVVLAKALLNTHFNPKAADLALEDYKPGDKLIPYKVIAEYKGPDLVGMEYEQLIPWVNPGEGAFRVISGDYVTTEDGTGIVHIGRHICKRVCKCRFIPRICRTFREKCVRPESYR